MSKRLIPVFILSLIQLLCTSGYGQGITATTSGTPSICYNDGTLAITASGGTGPYTYTITTGPPNPNITYPIHIPAGNNTFVNLPHGTYTVQVTDASGNTATITGTVSGTYQFPSLTLDTSAIPGILAIASDGLTPYQYAMSITGANTGFGPYQTSPAFRGICPGHYWVRVRDSCQNIFTNEIDYTYAFSDTLSCANYSKGFFSAHAFGGHPPYTYSFGSFTNGTGSFSSLPAYFFGSLTITDSCGIQLIENLGPPSVGLFEVCPFDSTIHSGSAGSLSPDTLTYICTDCTPPQRVLSTQLSGTVVFTNILPNHNYNIVILTTACGGDTLPNTLSFPSLTQYNIGNNATSCNSFVITAPGPFDSVILRNSAGTIVVINTTGEFFHLPAGTYTATGFPKASNHACYSGDSASTTVSVPFFPGYCEAMTRDSTCHTKLEVIVLSNPGLHDKFSLVTSPGDTIAGDDNGNSYFFFYGLNQGTYTLISDSGCSEQITLDSIPRITSSAVSFLPCIGPPTIQPGISGLSGNICSTFLSFQLTMHDTLVPYTQSPTGGIEVADSGWYTIRWYISSYDAHGNPFTYDALCPVDSNLIYVSNSHTPTPLTTTAYVCQPTPGDSVYYQIYGGFIPYTVEIFGFDTVTLLTNTGTFPTNAPGQYNMVVYDNCGISRSITFSIIDTCNGCPTGSIILPDTVFCLGDTVPLRNQNQGAVVYQWLINNNLVALQSDTSFIPTATGSYNVLLMIYSNSGCVDSLLSHFIVVAPYAIELGADTSYCDTFHRTLSTGIPATVWSTGQTGAQITVDTAGKYWARATNKCGTYSDTINITGNAAAIVNLGQDTIYCDAFSRVLSTGIATTLWSTGQAGAQITVNMPGKYWARATNVCGAYTDTINIKSHAIEGLELSAARTNICDNHPDSVVLHATVDSVAQARVTFIWSRGQVDSPVYSAALTAHAAGSYQVTAQDGQCLLFKTITLTAMKCDSTDSTIVIDSSCIHKMAVPNIFSPNGDNKNDTFMVLHLCPVYDFTIHIYNRWGQLVYESTDIDKGWDGTYSGAQEPEEVCSWFICVRETKDSPYQCSTGTVTLVR